MQQEWFVGASDDGEFYTQERCHITELMNSPLSPDVSLALARVEPGVTTQLHHLAGIAERYVLREGEGRVEVDGETQIVRAGDQVVIAAGAAQRITNVGTGDLLFYCVCTPRFAPQAYVSLED